MKLSPIQEKIINTSGNLIVRASAGTIKLLKKLMITVLTRLLRLLLLPLKQHKRLKIDCL